MIYEKFCLLHPFIRHFPWTHPSHSWLHLFFVSLFLVRVSATSIVSHFFFNLPSSSFAMVSTLVLLAGNISFFLSSTWFLGSLSLSLYIHIYLCLFSIFGYWFDVHTIKSVSRVDLFARSLARRVFVVLGWTVLPWEDQVVAEQNSGAYRKVEDSCATRHARPRTVGTMTVENDQVAWPSRNVFVVTASVVRSSRLFVFLRTSIRNEDNTDAERVCRIFRSLDF